MRLKRIRTNRVSSVRTDLAHTAVKQAAPQPSLKKWRGPYRVTDVSGPKGFGREPKSKRHQKGFWLIADVPIPLGDGETTAEVWFKAKMKQNEIEAVGMCADNWIGLYFEAYAESDYPQDLEGAKAKLVDEYGGDSFSVPVTTRRMPNRLESTQPTSVAGICGMFGIRFPDIGPIMESVAAATAKDEEV